MRRKSFSSRNRGFTIVELVTVTSLTTLLLAILLPAIQDTRDQARRIQCRNNLKSLGLALHNYHSTFRSFPMGWASRYRDAESTAAYSWGTFILPYIDQATLYNKINFSMTLPEADKNLSMPLARFQCPEDSELPHQNPFRGGYGRSNYSGNAGSIRPIRWSDGRVEAFWPGAVATFQSAPKINAPGETKALMKSPTMEESIQYSIDGIFGWNTRVGMREINDGTSNTLLIGERTQISGWGIWAGVGSNRFENDAVTDVSFLSPLNQSLTGFSSVHPGGLYVGLCDGSVRFLSNDIDSRPEGGVLQHLGNRSDGEVIPPDALGQ